jgi:hypothetical protein
MLDKGYDLPPLMLKTPTSRRRSGRKLAARRAAILNLLLVRAI